MLTLTSWQGPLIITAVQVLGRQIIPCILIYVLFLGACLVASRKLIQTPNALMF